MTTRIETTTPGVGANLSDDAAAQEAIGNAALRSVPGGRSEEKPGIMSKVKAFGETPVRLKHVGAAAGAALVVVGYEYLAARKDWGFRLGIFKNKKK